MGIEDVGSGGDGGKKERKGTARYTGPRSGIVNKDVTVASDSQYTQTAD